MGSQKLHYKNRKPNIPSYHKTNKNMMQAHHSMCDNIVKEIHICPVNFITRLVPKGKFSKAFNLIDLIIIKNKVKTAICT